jgi:RHS repeat-associated protein
MSSTYTLTISDHPMTNCLATNSTQHIVWRWEGKAFGNMPAEELAGISVNLRFPGQYYDTETNLHYDRNRHYDPSLGRYVTSDPMGLAGDFNTYLYVGANPVNQFDPDGLKARIRCRLIPWMRFTLAGHCYIERDVDGIVTTWGLIGDGGGGPRSTSGTVYINNGFDKRGVSGEWNEGCSVDECVEKAANAYPNPGEYRFARGPDSNTFAGTVARKCGLSKPSAFTPGWDNSPARQKKGTSKRSPSQP